MTRILEGRDFGVLALWVIAGGGGNPHVRSEMWGTRAFGLMGILEGSGGEEGRGDGGPLVFKGGLADGFVGAVVPVGSVAGIAFLAVEIGVDQVGVVGFEGVGDGVGAVPVAVGVVPQGEEQRREMGGAGGRESAEDFGGGREWGGGHGVDGAGWARWLSVDLVDTFGRGG